MLIDKRLKFEWILYFREVVFQLFLVILKKITKNKFFYFYNCISVN